MYKKNIIVVVIKIINEFDYFYRTRLTWVQSVHSQPKKTLLNQNQIEKNLSQYKMTNKYKIRKNHNISLITDGHNLL